jgi:hypothetical protein
MRLGVSVVLVVFTVLTIGDARSQERQIAFDSDGRVMVIDARIAQDLELFSEVEGFREARLFQHVDGAFTLEIRYIEAGQELIVRDAISESVREDLRRRVDSYVALQPRIGLDQAGRPYLLRRTAGMAYLVYGPTMVGILDIEEVGTGTAIMLVTGSAGFFVPFLLTREQPVPMPAARLAFSGSVLGYLHGLAVAAALGGEGVSQQALLGSALVLSLAEGYAGYRYGLNSEITEGTARMMTVGGWFGLGIGATASVLTFGDIEDFDEIEEGDTELRTMAAMSLVGSIGGIYAGNRLAQRDDYTLGDASVLASVGLLGLYNGLAITTLLDPSFKGGAALLLAGTSAGLVTGYALTRTTNFTTSQANYIDLGMGAGLLLGAAVGEIGGSDDETLGIVASALGATVGFAVMYMTYRGEAMSEHQRSNFRFQVAPVPGTLRPGIRLQHRW